MRKKHFKLLLLKVTVPHERFRSQPNRKFASVMAFLSRLTLNKEIMARLNSKTKIWSTCKIHSRHRWKNFTLNTKCSSKHGQQKIKGKAPLLGFGDRLNLIDIRFPSLVDFIGHKRRCMKLLLTCNSHGSKKFQIYILIHIDLQRIKSGNPSRFSYQWI